MADQSFILLRHDVLDAQLADADRQCIGRVDELLLDVSSGAPRVSSILIGGAVRAHRIGVLARAIRKVVHAVLRREVDPVSKVSFQRVTCIGDKIEVNVHGDELPSAHLEVWLRDHVISHIPGSSGEKK